MPRTSASSLYDKRGHGLSESGPDRSDMVDYADDLAALLDILGVGRATIVGLSIGGVIAQEFYRRRPERVAALVLCDTAAKVGTDASWDQRMAEVGRGGIEAIADFVLERWFTAAFRSERAAELAGMRAMLTRTPKQGYLAACGALKRADLRPYAERIQAPTLCLVGERTAPRQSPWLGKRRRSFRLALRGHSGRGASAECREAEDCRGVDRRTREAHRLLTSDARLA